MCFRLAKHWLELTDGKGINQNVGDNEDDNEEDSDENAVIPGSFNGVDLLIGWLVTKETVIEKMNNRKKKKTYEWTARVPKDCITDMITLISSLVSDLSERFDRIIPVEAKMMATIFDLDSAFIKLSNFSIVNERIEVSRNSRVDWETYGSTEFELFYQHVCNLPQVKDLLEKETELNLLVHDNSLVFRKYKSVLRDIVWGSNNDLMQNVLVDPLNMQPIKEISCHRMVKFEGINNKFSLDQIFLVTLSSGEEIEAMICEPFLISQFYTNPVIYEAVGKEMCISLDVALGASGCEAIVEGFYSVVKMHKMNGGQLNESLTQRAIVDWALPHPTQCRKTIRQISLLYTNGDKDLGLKKHRSVRFFDKRERASAKYGVGKVIDGLLKQELRCPHVVSDDL